MPRSSLRPLSSPPLSSRSFVALAGALALWGCGAAAGELSRPGRGAYVADAAELIGGESVDRMNELLGAVFRETDIELIAVSTPTLEGQPIAGYTNDLFQRWKVGERTRGNRGLLLVIAEEEQEVRLEVSYELEGMFTDAFVSYVEHEQMVPYFERGLIGDGVEATVELVAGRVFERVLGRSYDPQLSGPSDIGGFRSGGGGAQTSVPLNGERPRISQPVEDPLRAHFAAQPTAEAAWQRFLELNRRRIKDTELGIYDEAARRLVRRVNSNAGQDDIARKYSEAAYTIRQQGDRAAVVFLQDPHHKLAPWFFHRTAEGWQLDGGMYPDVIGYNHRNQWRFRRRDHPYMFAFFDFRFDRNGFGFPGRK